MRTPSLAIRVCRLAATFFCIHLLTAPHLALACIGGAGTVCIVNPSACLRSMVLTKSVPASVVIAPGTGASVDVGLTLYITCPTNNYCGNPCLSPSVPVSAMLTVRLYAGPCHAGGVVGTPVASGSIGTLVGTMTLPTCAPVTSGFNAYSVTVKVPPGTAAGTYCVIGAATVHFSDGTVLTQTGDTTVCLVDPAAGQPGVPRLSLQLLSEPFPRKAPGDQATATYRITNNDPSNSVTVTAFAAGRQNALRPQGANEAQGVFTISSPFGDDFPIQFNAGSNCIPLPDHPFTQPEITLPLPILPPGGTTNISVGIRSYGQCASGSCSESTLRVQGVFSDNSLASGCAGMSLIVDTTMPSSNCGTAVNDCNHNGIPDALDIAARRSADVNFNALPDECEAFINFPYFSSVTPTNPVAGTPIQVQVAFNEVVPMANAWANGTSLTRTQFFGTPFWAGTIPADTRPGPQTVYFLGKDSAGGLSSYIAPYTVRPANTVILLPPGFSSVADNFLSPPNNDLNSVLPLPDSSEGTQLFKWDSAAQAYDEPYQYLAGIGWFPSGGTLAPGEGAFINSLVPQTVTFNGQIAAAPPRPRPLPAFYLVGGRTPAPAAFEELMGFPPIIGDKMLKYDGTTPGAPQPTATNTFTINGWVPAPPVVAQGKAAFVLLAAPLPPAPILFAPVRLNNGSFQFSFSNVAGASYSVLASTNVALPVTNWLILGSPTNAGGGIWKFTDPPSTVSRRFYLLRSP